MNEALSALAGEAYDYFESAERPDGSKFTRMKDGAPTWVKELIYTAHGDFLPDDWRYDAIASALASISDDGLNMPLDELEHEWADGHVDIYTADRFAWLSSNLNRQWYVDEAIKELGWDAESGIVGAIGLGQYQESREVFQSVVGALEAVLEVDGDEDEDE